MPLKIMLNTQRNDRHDRRMSGVACRWAIPLLLCLITLSLATGATAQAPPAPTNLAATIGDGAATLSWAPVSGASEYDVYRSTTSGGPYTYLAYALGGTNSLTDSGLRNGTSYYYVIKAYASGAYSPYSAEVAANVSLAAPTLSASVTDVGTATLSWSPVSGADEYDVFRSATSGGPYTYLAYALGGATSLADASLRNGSSYYYVIKAYNAGGYGAYSNEASVFPTISTPVVSSAAGDGTATLSWSPVSSASEYDVYRSATHGGPYTYLTYALGGTNSITDTGLQNGSVYYYVVKSYNAAGYSPYSNEVSASPSAGSSAGVPSVPMNLAAVPGDQQVALSWTASDGVIGYTVKRATTSGGPYTNVTNPGTVTGTSFINHYLTNETTYYFVVTAANNAGESANSAEVSATPFGLPPDSPASLTAVPGAGQVSLSWAAPPGPVRGYTVQRATTTGGPYTTLATGPSTTYTDTAVTNGIPYFYVVSAFNTGGSSPVSDEAMAQPFVSPAAPSVTPNYGYSSDGMRAWKSVGGSTTYFLYDGSNPVCELDGTGAVTATNTWGGSLLSRRVATASTFYTFDPSGSVAQRLDASANVLGAYAFDAFGLRTGTDSTTDPYAGFGGGYGYYADAETGLSLLGHRYYDTGTGRFVTRDPIGYDGGINLYAYTQNNPINEIDPDGTDGYFQDVGQVFAGYGDVLNPVNIYKGVVNISQIAGSDGFGAAGSALGQGILHGLTDWTSTSDPRHFGQSFGTTLLTVAPGLKRIPNLTPIKLTGLYLSGDGLTLLRVDDINRLGAGGKLEPQVCRVDVGRLPSAGKGSTQIPSLLRGKYMLHYHRRGSGPIAKHRPWQGGGGSRW